MRILRRCLLPLFTAFVVAAAILLPPYLSRLGDQKRMNEIHMETISGDRLSVKATTLRERIDLLYRWQNGELEAITQPLTSYELQTKIQPMAYQSVDKLYQAVPLMASVLQSVWSPDVISGNRLLLRDGYHGLIASVLQLRGTRQAALVIDEQTGLVLSLTLSESDLGPLEPMDAYSTAPCAMEYMDYLGLGGVMMDGGEIETLFNLSGTNVYYLLRSVPGEFSLAPVDFQSTTSS